MKCTCCLSLTLRKGALALLGHQPVFVHDIKLPKSQYRRERRREPLPLIHG